jgi:mono/diheme cytochrome c family protein
MNARQLRPVLALFAALACSHALAASDDAAATQRGAYLATAGDCAACHSVPGAQPFAGGLGIPTPLGNIVSTNITPSKTAGIGNYTEAQFRDALRKGIRADGKHLYPAMPYTAYAQLDDADVLALYDYFMHEVKPVDTSTTPTRLPFPFNIRLSMAAWNLLFLDRKPFAADPARSTEWNRGAYLVRGLVHCSTCHTPRNLLMAEESSRELAGGAVGTWFASNITSDPSSGIGNWSMAQLVAYLKLGHVSGKAQAAGPMAEAVDNSLRHLTDADLQAIASYLKTVPPRHDPADTRAVDSWGGPSAEPDVARTTLPDDADKMSGAQIYDAYCASCHQARGQGSFDGGLPPLFHNTATGRTNTANLVMVILDGIRWHTDDSGVHMPGFAHELSDRQIATLGNWLLQHYGNPAGTVNVDQVHTLRAGGASSHLVLLARLAIAVIVLLLIVVIFWLLRRRKRPRARTF